jgi:TatD DNase family protein
MSLIDSHCHLEMLDDARVAVQAARNVGVEHVVSIGIDLPTSRQAVAFARELPGVFATVALHPHEAHTLSDELLAELESLAAEPRVVAVGECGLDFFRDLSPRDAQRRAFSAQIALARRAGLPLVVHVREAGDEAMAQLAAEADGLTVIMHCFSLPQHLDECNARGYYASFAGNVTYKNAGDLRDAAARVREDRIMVETDAPFLSPVPNRGKANTPAWVRHTAALVAELRGWSADELADVTTANARRAFALPDEEQPAVAEHGAPTGAAGDRGRPPRPKALHRYGQNHLVDRNILRVIIEQAAVTPDDVVLEVGAAGGLLTRPLLEQAGVVHAFEIDARWLPRLRELARERPQLVLHPGDALKADLSALDPPPTALVANLAYNIAIPLVMTSLTALPSVQRWAVMVQKELGDRLFAAPRTKAYAAVSVLTQLACRLEKARPVPPSAFRPQPRVDSSFITFVRRAPAARPVGAGPTAAGSTGEAGDGAPSAAEYAAVSRLVRIAFGQRRKTLANSLNGAAQGGGGVHAPRVRAGAARAETRADGAVQGDAVPSGLTLTREAIFAGLDELGLLPAARPEELTPAQWLRFAAALGWLPNDTTR